MAIARDRASNLGQVSSGLTVTCSWTVNPVAGASVVVVVQSATTIPTRILVTDNGTSPSTFVLDAFSTAGKGIFIFHANRITLPAAGQYTVTVTFMGSSGTIQVSGWTYTTDQQGLVAVSKNSNTATGTAVDSAATVGDDGALFVAGFSDASGLNPETITHTGTFTEEFRNTNGSSFWPFAWSDKIVSGSGATSQNDTWTLGDSVAWGAAIVAYVEGNIDAQAEPRYITSRRKYSGPQVLRMQHWRDANYEILPDPQTTPFAPLLFPHSFVGPMSWRRRNRQDQPRYWSETISGNFIFVTASDTLDAISDFAQREAQAFSRTASDSLSSISDVASRLIALPRTVADSIGSLSDVASRLIRLPRTASDSLGALSDSAVRAAQSFSRTASDSLNALSDVANRLIALPRTAADSLAAITESTVVQKGITRTASDTLGAISDSAVRSAQSFSRTASDTISSLTDSAVRAAQSFSRTASDALDAITESTIVQKGISRTATDTIGAISDSAVRSATTKLRTATDTITSLSDSAVRSAQSFSRTATDSLGALADSAVRLTARARTATDSIAGQSDSTTRTTARSRTASDSINPIADVAVRAAQSLFRTALDLLDALIDLAILGSGILDERDAITLSRDGVGTVYSRDGGIVESRDGIGEITTMDEH